MSKKHDEPERDEEAEITSRQAVLRAEKEAEERYLKEQAEKEAERARNPDPVIEAERARREGRSAPEAKTEDAGEPEVPARFLTGGATYDEKQEWYRANRPELADPEPVLVPEGTPEATPEGDTKRVADRLAGMVARSRAEEKAEQARKHRE